MNVVVHQLAITITRQPGHAARNTTPVVYVHASRMPSSQTA